MSISPSTISWVDTECSLDGSLGPDDAEDRGESMTPECLVCHKEFVSGSGRKNPDGKDRLETQRRCWTVTRLINFYKLFAYGR